MDLPQRFDIPARYRIRRLAAKLRRASPIRRWLETNREPREDSAVTLFQALEQTTECRWRDRAVAYHILGVIDLDSQEREQVARLLVTALQYPEMDPISNARFGGVMGGACLGWWLFGSALALAWHSDLPNFWGTFCIGLTSAPVVLMFQDRIRTHTTQRIAATALASVGNPSCIEALWQQARTLRKAGAAQREALEALKALLPFVTGDWYGHLPAGTDAALTDLAKSADIDIALAALNALEQAGGGSSAKTIARLAKSARSNRVRERAAAVLPILIARRENEKSASMLLRPSAPDQTEHLLHPVYSSSDPNLDNLLRASHAESPAAPAKATDNL